MAEVIELKDFLPASSGGKGAPINPHALKTVPRKLTTGIIAPAEDPCRCPALKEHTSEPIKDMNDIFRVSEYLVEHERYRDNMLFIVGINFGLRVSDLLSLRFSDLIDDNLVFRDTFAILEKKTRNTRKRPKNRYLTINTAVVEAVTLYLENTESVCLSDYLFRSESNHGMSTNAPMHRNSVDRILKQVGAALSLPNKMSTHTLRKTFAYHQMVMSGNDPRKLLLLQKMFGHSTSAQTLEYIGITGDEIKQAYQAINLGSKDHNYLVDSSIVEPGATDIDPILTATLEEVSAERDSVPNSQSLLG